MWQDALLLVAASGEAAPCGRLLVSAIRRAQMSTTDWSCALDVSNPCRTAGDQPLTFGARGKRFAVAHRAVGHSGRDRRSRKQWRREIDPRCRTRPRHCVTN